MSQGSGCAGRGTRSAARSDVRRVCQPGRIRRSAGPARPEGAGQAGAAGRGAGGVKYKTYFLNVLRRAQMVLSAPPPVASHRSASFKLRPSIAETASTFSGPLMRRPSLSDAKWSLSAIASHGSAFGWSCLFARTRIGSMRSATDERSTSASAAAASDSRALSAASTTKTTPSSGRVAYFAQ